MHNCFWGISVKICEAFQRAFSWIQISKLWQVCPVLCSCWNPGRDKTSQYSCPLSNWREGSTVSIGLPCWTYLCWFWACCSRSICCGGCHTTRVVGSRNKPLLIFLVFSNNALIIQLKITPMLIDFIAVDPNGIGSKKHRPPPWYMTEYHPLSSRPACPAIDFIISSY